MRSLRRALALRFAATMAIGLALGSAALFLGTSLAVRGLTDSGTGGASLHLVQRDLLVALVALVVLGTGAALVGAWWLAGSAVRPVAEITAQATGIEAGTLEQRIEAHA